jgi:hypothetical protein
VPLESLVVFPLFGITSDGACACGNVSCARVGRHAAVLWGDLKLGDEVSLPEPGAGYGIKTGAAPRGSGIIVVDIDSDEAGEAWCELERLGRGEGEEDDSTYTVRSGRGWHLYFKHPGFPVKNSVGELAPGIDIRGDGGIVVGPGSPHRSGATYTVELDVPPAPAPKWLLEWLRARPAPEEIQSYPGDVTDPEERARLREKYTEFLSTTPHIRCPENRGRGDALLFEVVQRGAYDLALPTEDVLELIREHYDPRNDRPWGDELEERVIHKAHDAKTTSTRPRAAPMSADLERFLEMPPTPPPEPDPPGKPKRQKGILWGGWGEKPPPIDYLIEGLIPAATVGMFVAMGSSLKTWTALDIARSVAKGSRWLDRYPVQRGRAVIADYESGHIELQRRVWLLERGDVADLGAWTYPPLRIDDENFWKEIGGVKDLRLVVVDSLAAGAAGIDENDVEAAGPLKLAARFTEATGAAVLFIHHATKGDGGGDARKIVRGNSAIFNDCDWIYRFDNVEETPTYRRMVMSSIKTSIGTAPAPVRLELTDDGLAWFDEEQASPRLTTKEATPEAIQKAILVALAGAGEEGIPNKAEIARVLGLRKEIVSPQVDVLEVREEITQLKKVGYVLDSMAARERRIVAAVKGETTWRSEAQIAKAAGADTADVSRMVREGVIVRSAEGRFIATGN